MLGASARTGLFFLNFSSGVCGHGNPGQGGDGKEGKFKAITTVQLPTAMTWEG